MSARSCQAQAAAVAIERVSDWIRECYRLECELAIAGELSRTKL